MVHVNDYYICLNLSKEQIEIKEKQKNEQLKIKGAFIMNEPRPSLGL